MSKYWSKLALKTESYVPGEQPKDKKYIKLNTNENPYPPSPKVIEAIKAAVDTDLKLYPDPNGEALRRTLADYLGMKREQVFVGNGSDEVLAFAFMAFFDPHHPILFPDITYSFYPVYAGLFNIDYRLIALNEDFTLPTEQFLEPNGGIIFPNPNAPTGDYTSLRDIEKILIHNPDRVVVVDEAYIDFGGTSATGLIEQYPNLLVVQTFSKSRSLAGLRVGFALGQEELIEGLNKIKNSINSYPLDRLAYAGAIAAIQDEEYFETTRRKIIATRERVTLEIRKLGFQIIPSQANFILMSHPSLMADELFLALKTEGILVRYFRLPRIDNFLRVTIGSDEEMDSLISALTRMI